MTQPFAQRSNSLTKGQGAIPVLSTADASASSVTNTGSTEIECPEANLVSVAISGTYVGSTLVAEGTLDGTNWTTLPWINPLTGVVTQTSLTPTSGTAVTYVIPKAGNRRVRIRQSAFTSGNGPSVFLCGMAQAGSFTEVQGASPGTAGGVPLERTATGDITTAAGAATAYVELACPGAGAAIVSLSGTFAGYTIVCDGMLNGVATTIGLSPLTTADHLTSIALTDSTAARYRIPNAGSYDSIRVRATARTSGTLSAYIAATDHVGLPPRIDVRHETITDTSPSSASTAASATVLTGMAPYDTLAVRTTGAGGTGGTLDTYVIDSDDLGVTWRELVHFPQKAIAAASATVSTCGVLDSTHTAIARSTTKTSAVGTLGAGATRPGHWGDYITLVYVAGTSTSAGASQTTTFTAHNSRR